MYLLSYLLMTDCLMHDKFVLDTYSLKIQPLLGTQSYLAPDTGECAPP